MIKLQCLGSYISFFLRLILGSLFIISGYVKAVDPVGLSYKLEEYLTVFGFNHLHNYSIILSIFLCAFELFIGIMILAKVFGKLIALITLITLFLFSILTYYIYFDLSIQITDCGCFGEFISLSNLETFIKNIILTFVAIIYFIFSYKQKYLELTYKPFITTFLVLIFSIVIPLYSYTYLPPFDFLGYNIGQEISTDTSSDSSLNIFDKKFNNVTKDILLRSSIPILAIVVKDSIPKSKIQDFTALRKLKDEKKIDVIIITSNNMDTDFIFNERNDINAYFVDITTIKSLIRSKSGMVLFKNRVISGKWTLLSNPFNRNDISINSIIKRETTLIYKYFFLISVFLILLFIYIHSDLFINRINKVIQKNHKNKA